MLFTLFLGHVHGLDVSLDGSVVVGASESIVIAHNTATGAELWRKEMDREVETLRIHGDVVFAVVNKSKTVVLDVSTGHQIHALPTFGKGVNGVCVFDGLTGEYVCFVESPTLIFLAPRCKLALKADDHIDSGLALVRYLSFYDLFIYLSRLI